MSTTTIDQRVVEMKFDNKQFETGASETMSTLQKLKKSLDFSKVGDSFDNINKAANKVDMSGLDRVITGIHHKFSALEVMAITTLGNITNSFVNSAKRWVSAFTIEPIKTGFQEYETQINAVQTILANTQKEGTNIKDVNSALDELNTYADKTIYNFTEMTRNIGTFTAAGVDLKTSVNAIQGIANLAAVSGSNSQQASTAMYQLSQALSTGTLRLMDWNSVVNAGMGGQLFQDALKETSRLLGTGAEAAIEAEGSFRESLKAGWLTSEVLTETLKKFTTSGATEYVANYTGLTKEAIESELELAKSTYGEAEAMDKAAEALAKKSGKNKDEIAATLKFAQTAEDAATKVKTFTQLIDTLKEAVQSGWSQSFRIIVGDFEEAKKLFTEISDSFGAVISASADARNKLLSEVFNKKDAQDYMASIVDVPKEAIAELQIVAKEAGTTSKIFKDTLNEFTEGDEVLNSVMTNLIGMLSSEKNVVSYISDMTGMQEKSIAELQKLGKEFGYASDEFKTFANVLAKGNPKMESTITHLLEMNDVMTKPSGRELLIDSLRNGLKGLLSVIKPVREAFREVFPPATAEQVLGMLKSFNEFTKTLKLSEKNSENLKKAFKGLFDIAKLLKDGFISLVKIIIPIEKPVGSLSNGFLALVGYLGGLLSKFSNGVRSSELLSKAFNSLRKGSSALMGGLSKLIKTGVKFVEKLSEMEGTAKLIDSVKNAFKNLYNKASSYISNFVLLIDDLFDSLFNFEDINIDDTLKTISDAFADLASNINGFNFKSVGNAFDTLALKIKKLSDVLMSNEGLSTFVTNFKTYGEELKNAFTLDNLLDRLERIMDVFGKFFNWIKTTLKPAFEDFNIGTAAAGAGGLGIVYALIKTSKAFEGIAGTLKSIPDLLGGVSDTLQAYQKDLKASALIKTAGAIAILAAALVLLSFADTERLLEASIALALVSGVLMLGVSKLLEAVNKGKELNSALKIFSKGLSKTMQDFGKAVKWKAIGGAVKDFATSIAIIAASIIGLGIMYKKDSNSLLAAVDLVKEIGIAIVVMMGIGSIAGHFAGKGMENFSGLLKSVAGLTFALFAVVGALNKLFKMDFPSNWKDRVGILAGIFGGLAALAIVVGIAGRIAGGGSASLLGGMKGPFGSILSGVSSSANGGAITAAPILSLAAMLYVSVLALDKLFKMEIPSDCESRFKILAGIFGGLAVLAIAMGAAAKLSGGNGIKAAGTILAMAGFLVVVVGSLFVLTLIPVDKMFKGAVALGGILVTLAAALAGAGKIADKEAGKTVIAMAATVGVITAALAILSMIPWKKLAVSVVSLGVVLLALAANFQALSKVRSKKALPAVLAMIAATLIISNSLETLSKQPWQGMITAAAAMSATMAAFALSFQMILSKNWSENNVKKIGTFLLLTTAVIPIGVALAILAHQPWEGMLAAAGAMSATIAAFALSFDIILSKNWGKNNIDKIKSFLLLTVAVVPIGAALYVLAFQPWQNMLAAVGAMSATLLAFTACFAILSKVKVDPMAIASVVAGSASLLLVAAGISMLAQYDGTSLLNSCLALAGMLVVMVGVMAACSALSAVIGPAMIGVLGLGAVIAELALVLAAIGGLAQIPGLKWLIEEGGALLQGVGTAIGQFIGGIVGGIMGGISAQLPQLGSDLSQFMVNLTPFIMGSKMIDAQSLACVGLLAGIILALTAAEVVNGITSLFGLSLVDMAVELSDFMTALGPFIESSNKLTTESMKACTYLAGMIIALTAAEILSGIGKVLGLNGSLASFGEELSVFGPYIKKFAEDVKDVKPEAVQGAAAAAEIMAKVAKKLPAQGGFIQKVFGKKSLAQFGYELVKFGPAIRDFGDTVKDVKPEAVEGAAAAAEIMANLADNLPTQGGFIQKIFGEKSLAQFGEELISFGPKISEFADQVKNIKPASVIGASMVTSIMSKLANELPSSDTIWDKLFGGGKMSLSEFGEELIPFGESMSGFSDSVSGMNITKVNGAITGFKNLVDLSSYVKESSAEGLVNFSKDLEGISTDTVNNFVQTFTDAGPKAIDSVNGLLTGVLSVITTEGAVIRNTTVTTVNNLINTVLALMTSGGFNIQNRAIMVGNNLCYGIQNGITSKQYNVISSEKMLTTNMVSTLRSNLPATTFNGIGQNTSIAMANGITSAKNSVSNSSKSVAEAARYGVQNNISYNDFYSIGSQVVNGLASGISSKIGNIANSAINVAKSAIKAAKRALGIHSPSKVFKEIGEYVSIGLSDGIISKVSSVSNASDNIANEAIKVVKDTLSGISDSMEDIDTTYEPKIVPVIDLSNVSGAANQISSTFNGLDLSSTMGLAQSVSYDFTKRRSKSESTDQYNKNLEKKIDQLAQNRDESPKIENTNTFYIQSTDPKQAAEEVGYIMQHKVERGKATWAK